MLRWIWEEPEQDRADRKTERYDVVLYVKSRDLPGYRALTEDISAGGLQLNTEKLLTKGAVLLLDLEFDREELPNFSCPAEVVWARADDTRRLFQAGLAFRPVEEKQRLDLARMGAVLERRSEVDIQQLLVEASRLDSTRHSYFSQRDGASPPMGKPPTQVSRSATPAPPNSESGHPGVLVPLDVIIRGYKWDDKRTLTLFYSDGEFGHHLHFPDCQVYHDHGCSYFSRATAFYATTQSDMLREIRASRGSRGWRHYRFLAHGGEPILDIISAPCQA